jgi:hypothetical protein
VIAECRQKRITRVDILGFEFEMGLFPNVLDEDLPHQEGSGNWNTLTTSWPMFSTSSIFLRNSSDSVVKARPRSMLQHNAVVLERLSGLPARVNVYGLGPALRQFIGYRQCNARA